MHVAFIGALGTGVTGRPGPTAAMGCGRPTDPGGNRVIRVVVAVDTPLFRGALTALLERENGVDVVGEAAEWPDAEAAVRLHQPDVVVLDIKFAGWDLLSAAVRLCGTPPSTRALILLEAGRHDVLARVGEPDLYTVGFVTKQASPDHLVSAVRSLANGSPVIDPELVVSVLTSPGNPLTEREQGILSMAAEGAPVNEIATKLFLSVGTVRNYLSRINVKTGASNRIQAIVRARQAGWL
jgi:two-component system response regulator DesR